MASELPAQSIVAIATVVASLIAAVVSFVNLTLTKEQKTSEFRQTWIDALREDLATFFACARAFARTIEAKHALGDVYKNNVIFPITEEKISEIRFQIAEVHYRIKLRLNPDEPDHKELLRLMGVAISKQNAMSQEKTSGAETLKAIELAADFAGPILKTEWERVKRGELAFRIARNWVAPAIFLLCITFVIFVWNGTFKI